jgi:D-galactarolactone cycloisomerase
MRITALRGYVLAHRLPEPQGNASGYYDLRTSLVIELVGDRGYSGWGETWHSPLAAGAIIRESLAAAVLGADATRPRALLAAMMRRRGYDRGGITVMAASAIEMACWDLLARTERRPLHALLGGKLRDRVGVYAAGPYLKPGGDPYRAFATEAESYAKANLRAVKAKIGVTPADDERAVGMLRHAVGDEASLMVDANQGLSARVAIETAQRLRPHGLLWFEEPVPPEDLDGYRLFAAHSGIAPSGGEALGELTAFRNLLECGVTVLQPDLSICGGFCVALEAAALARAYGAALVPHVWGTGINLHAALQLLAVLHETPNGTLRPFPWLELDRSPNPLRSLWGEPAIATDGTTSIPDGPGLGIDIEPAHFEAYLNDRWSLDAP